MEENKNKLFVFDKKEVFLIFIFLILIAITAFTVGVRVGKNLLLKSEGHTSEEISKLDIKTEREEEIENMMREVAPLPQNEDDAYEAYKDRLDQELQETITEESPAPEIEEPSNPFEESLNSITEVKESDNAENYSGKWTVQIVSFPDKESAVDFANGFVARGYNPIINSVALKERGTWYRVSLGLFDTKAEAAAYVKDNDIIFGGKEYQIYQIK